MLIMATAISIDHAGLAALCRRHHIRRLSLFGSVLRPDFRPDSDVDMLVEFEPGEVPGFFALYDIEVELSKLVGSRKVDLVTQGSLHPRLRDGIIASAEVEYAAG
jgi:predicted nucleotidyltransferase